jgi:uncharacterized protein YjiS (DUF1127 family)
MNLLTARAGADLRQLHSRSFRSATTTVAVSHAVATGPLAWLSSRYAAWRHAAALRRELDNLGDTALADLGLTRAGIADHVRQVMVRRRRAPRAQSSDQLSEHLLQDLAVQLHQGRARVYTDVPLGVITRRPTVEMPANAQRWRRTA